MKTRHLVVEILLGWAVLAASPVFAGWANCPAGHCSKVDAEMNQFCIANGMAGKPYLVFEPNGTKCLCPCSCVTEDTSIELSDSAVPTAIADLKIGDYVTSPFSLHPTKVDRLLASDLTENPATVHYLRFSNGSELVASGEHTFVSPGKKVRSAEELQPGMVVLDRDLRPIEVLENSTELFTGRLMNFIVNEDSTKASRHFVVNNGVLSGDWLIQANYSSFKNEIDARLGRIRTFHGKTKN